MKTRSSGRSDEIDAGDAPRSVRQRRSRLKMPKRNAHANVALSENEALNDSQAQEFQVHSAVNGSNFSMMGENCGATLRVSHDG